ncbi:hypothetical protein B5M47_02420 [candidate division CPR3 bacterium 4484_211]|uniref:Uncharacterized protein n=1 Tax=candidate division CPR3 bacterium 4484_211 TaxID=1968527 RepID=A0A1W9NXR1_UNCC3|nr:MAG: hypothetical protein B5M47_02420 [candidate division CPR3 bacterium 4484_211]
MVKVVDSRQGTGRRATTKNKSISFSDNPRNHTGPCPPNFGDAGFFYDNCQKSSLSDNFWPVEN